MWLIKFWTNILAGFAAIATILSLAGRKWWVFALMEHPRVQYSLILVIALFVSLLTSKKRINIWNFLCTITLLINLILILPLFIHPNQTSTQAVNTAPQTIRVIHATLDSKQPDVTKAIEYLNKQETDILFLLEVTPQSLTQLNRGLTNYRLIATLPEYNSHGIAWFIPQEKTKSIELRTVEFITLPIYNNRALLKATISYKGREITLLCFHVISPRNAETVTYQEIEFDALANWSQILQKSKQDLIVIGDFNSTPWYGPFRQLLNKSGLINSQRGFGIQTTWHSTYPPIFRIPIDNCLHSKSLTTVRRFIGSNIGSDHLPLFVELRLN
ncbi:endonuclease/exonuclease/phosphatase family protein [Rivularia sp. UHCC 0363]|uniref:endonuclease/exonuclease/phosphatase family protein n=1 Tax=Rivularia sp. UHCC 0363 TaxID=3110244 RepID=UPI002B200A9B|nr:endonuclease/exonuclease/phosphatase family protein [Rivularia sp. UHCC 0363]MEA5596431.1 endonuclease/exonuclease/phosphatase family protein [Rivularia sp. UHCC 0363]